MGIQPAFWRRSVALIIGAAAITAFAFIAQASTATHCVPNTPGYCVELAGVFANVNGATSRYAVRNLSASPASTLHEFLVDGASQSVIDAAIQPNAKRVFTLTSFVAGVTGDLVVKADQPITIEVLSPARWVYAPVVVRAEPTPAPTATPRPNCDAAYPDVCIPPPPPYLKCSQIIYRNFRVLPPDPHGFDADHDGIGCET